MKANQKIKWTKLPSVVREGKYFYRAIIGELGVTVQCSWMTGKWGIHASNGFEADRQFDSAKEAMAAIGDYIHLWN